MPVPEYHIPGLAGTLYQDDHKAWITRVLTHGLSASYPEIADLQWMMPGERLLPSATVIKNYQGPDGQPCRYMVVGAAPEFDEHRNKKYLSTNAGLVLRGALESAGFDLKDVYYTSIMRIPRPLNATTFKQVWLRLGWEYFLEEFQRLKPIAVLFMGAEACKLAFGTRYTLDSLRGQLGSFTAGAWTAKAIGCNAHYSFASNTAGIESLIKQLAFFRDVANQRTLVALDGLSYPDRDYRVLWTPEEIEAEIRAEIAAGYEEIAIDVETGTDTGRPDHNYVTTFQWSHGPGHARIIPLLAERPEPIGEDGLPKYGGSGVDRKSKADRFPHYELAATWIRNLINNTKRLIGQNLRGDLVSIRDEFGIEIRQFCTAERSWDTMLAYHLLAKDEYGLKQMVLRFTDMGAYDAPMMRWCIDNSGEGKILPGSEDDRFFNGFRDIAYTYLLPYAMCDPDATFRVYRVLKPWLEQAGNEDLAKIYYQIELPIQAALIDVEDNGIPADPDRLESLGEIYKTKYQSLLEELQAMLWPTFNPNSTAQLVWYLFKGPYKGETDQDEKMAEVPGAPQAPRLGAQPLITTGKYGKRWETLLPNELLFNSPCGEADVIKALLRTYKDDPVHAKILQTLINFKELKQFVSLFLRDPEYDPDRCETHPIYGKGLRGCIRDNGRVSTRISTLSETGRWKHSQPNLANLPKRKEKGIEKIFGAKVPAVKTGFKAREGWVFVEADYKSAELFTLGYMSQDEAFNKVLDTEPDVHGYNAVEVFKLDIKPSEVESKRPELRDAIKTTIFGIIYGLGEDGLGEQLTPIFKRDVPGTEARGIIEGLLKKYPGIKNFIDESKRDVETKGYTETAYMRRRYFPGYATMSRAKQSAAKREGVNSRIQGTVGDCLNLASIHLDHMRYETEIGQRIKWEYMVAIHDAMLLHCPKDELLTVARILKYCMSDTVPFPTRPDRCLQVDVQYGERWGEFTKLKH